MIRPKISVTRILSSLALALFLAIGSVPTLAYTFPTTNALNKAGTNPERSGIGPHVNLVEAKVGEITLEFVNPYNYAACFEYRSDGQSSQYGNIYPHPIVTGDYYYYYKCVTNSTFTKTLTANGYVEVRQALGLKTIGISNGLVLTSKPLLPSQQSLVLPILVCPVEQSLTSIRLP